MTAISFTVNKISTDPAKGSVLKQFQAASAISEPLGKPVYVDSDGNVALSDANATATEARAIGIIVALPNRYSENSIPAGESLTVCVFGPVWGFSGLAEGTYGYVSKTAGEIDDTAPTGGAYQYVLGQCLEQDCFFVHPGMAIPASV